MNTWLSNEILQPMRRFWHWSKQKFVLFCILSMLLQSLCFLLFPSIWLPSKLEQAILIQPQTHLQKGKIHTLVIQSGHQKYVANCAVQMHKLADYCKQITVHKQNVAVSHLSLIYMTTPLWHYKNSKKEVFIQDIDLRHSSKSTLNMHAVTSEQNTWLIHQQTIPKIVKWLLILNLLYLIAVLAAKIKVKPL